MNNFFRKKNILFTFALLLLLGLGCKGLSQEELAAIRPVTLDYWTVENDVEQLQAFADGYKQIRPYVTVRVKKVREDQFADKFLNALADDKGPDIISVRNQNLGHYIPRLSRMPKSVQVANISIRGKYSKETVVTLEQKSMPNVNAIKRNFVAAVGGDVVRGNRVYGLPLSLDTMALYYNADLLDQVGIATPPRTWTEFLDAVKKTTTFDADGNIIQSGVALGTGTNIDHAFDIMSLLIMQNDISLSKSGRVAFSDGLSDKTVNNHPTLQALRFYTDFARPTKEVYSWNEDQENALQAFSAGKTAFYFGFSNEYRGIRSRARQFGVEVVPIPQLNESKPVNVASYWVESVVKKSKNQDEAWDFIVFMTGDSALQTYSKKTGQPSPLRAHVAAQMEDEKLGPFASQVLSAQNWYTGADLAAAKKAFSDLVEDYLQPYGETQSRAERDANLVIRAARVVQQTMQ